MSTESVDTTEWEWKIELKTGRLLEGLIMFRFLPVSSPSTMHIHSEQATGILPPGKAYDDSSLKKLNKLGKDNISKFVGASEGSHYHLGILQALSLIANFLSIDPPSKFNSQHFLAHPRNKFQKKGQDLLGQQSYLHKSRNIYPIHLGLLSS